MLQKLVFSFIISVIATVPALTYANLGPKDCKFVFNKKNKVFESADIKYIPRTKSLDLRGNIPDFKDSDIYVGISGRHIWLSSGGKRVDGDFFLDGNSQVTNDYRMHRKYGVLFRIKDAPNEVVERLHQFLESYTKKFEVGCSRATCKALDKAGFKVPFFSSFLPSTTILSLYKNGFKTKDNMVLIPEVYFMGELGVKEGFHQAVRGDIYDLGQIAFYTAGLASFIYNFL